MDAASEAKKTVADAISSTTGRPVTFAPGSTQTVSNGILKIVETGRVGEVYHFSPEEFFSIKDIVMMICDELDADFDKHTKVKMGNMQKIPAV